MRRNLIYGLAVVWACVQSLSVWAAPIAIERGKKFMISAANPHAAEVGYQVLKVGGTAADAMVAVQMMLNLVEPQSSGIGGGAFLLYWDQKEKQLHSFDGREKAPLLATESYFLQDDGTPLAWWDAVVGGRSVGVPGTLKLLDVVHQRFGHRAWASLIHPTIDLAEKGFLISPRLANSIAAHDTDTRQLKKFSTTRRYFFDDKGVPKKAGTFLKNKDFANTLRKIAAFRSHPFYFGEIADAIVRTVRADKDNPGILTQEDFASYDVIEREPICIPYRHYQVCGMGPPTSGGLTVGQILGMLSHFPIHKMKIDSAEVAHLFAEGARLAYADRALYMADSDFVFVPISGLINQNYLRQRAMLINPEQAMEKAQAGIPPPLVAALFAADHHVENPGTSHFVIVDRYGNIASMTTTIETGFGSRLMAGGFLLNNELTDFSRVPTKEGLKVANRVQASKRPRSSMSPTIVFRNQRPVLAIGSPGGSRIINYVAQTLIGILDGKLTPQQAIDWGRIVNRNGKTELEQGTSMARLQSALERKGHTVEIKENVSGLHAIQLSNFSLIGGADKRREGVVYGE